MTRFEIFLRSLLRSAGLTRWLRPRDQVRRALHKRDYARTRPSQFRATVAGHTAQFAVGSEQEYLILRSKEEDYASVGLLSAELRPGDTYWDVGSSLGFFAVLLGQAVGPEGRVVAFEPDPRSRERLTENVLSNQLVDRVRVEALALGREPGTLRLALAPSFADGSHKLVADASQAGNRELVEVEVSTGDSLIAERGYTVPTAIKIDVEGAELEVFAGLATTLRDRRLRIVLCEVHFGLLEERGLPDGPLQVEALLKDAGFSRVDWPDASHIVARR